MISKESGFISEVHYFIIISSHGFIYNIYFNKPRTRSHSINTYDKFVVYFVISLSPVYNMYSIFSTKSAHKKKYGNITLRFNHVNTAVAAAAAVSK